MKSLPNGQIVQRGGKTVVEWPADAPDLRVRLGDDVSPAFTVNQPAFLKLVKEAIAAGDSGKPPKR